MTTQIDVLNANIAAAEAQQATNTANAARQNTTLSLQITNWQSQIATLQATPTPSPTPTGN